MNSTNQEFNKRYFELKGSSAEQAVEELARRSFLTEWCYPNPKDEKGDEICDLLVHFDGSLLIVQIKNIAFKGNEDRYIKRAFEEPVRQIHGAERRLLDYGEPVTVTNAFGVTEIINRENMRSVHRLVLSVGDGNVPYNMMSEDRDKVIHTFDRSVVTVLNELDTVSDFFKYLTDKEQLLGLSKPIEIVAYREVDLMGDYIFNGKSFDHLHEHDLVILEEDIWDEISGRAEFLAKKKADRVSYIWDQLIELSHTCPGDDYRHVAREMSRLNRFERRCAADAFMSAHMKALKSEGDFRRTWEICGTTYVMVLTPPDRIRSQRVAQLENVCIVARHKYGHNSKVVGIATEIGVSNLRSHDFFYMDFPVWDEENQALAESIQKEYKVLIDPDQSPAHYDEYPSDDEN